MPDIDSKKITLLEFASTLKNSVTAIKSLNHLGYLYSPDLYNITLKKIPNSLIHSYVRYAYTVDKEKADLEKLADFLYEEAEMALNAGVIDMCAELPNDKIVNRKSSNTKSVLAVSITQSQSREKEQKQSKACIICNRENHSIGNCREFGRETIR